MHTKTPSISLKLATLAGAMALCGAAYAAPGQAAAASAPGQESAAVSTQDFGGPKARWQHHKHGQRHAFRDAAMWVPGYGPLSKDFVKSLSLNEQQSKLLADAQAEQKAGRKAMRDAMEAGRAARMEQIKAGKLDPRAVVKQSETAREQARAEGAKMQEKWLAVWDALDEAQQGKVAAYLNGRAERFGQRMEGHHHRGMGPGERRAS